jgi:hypothetical protein
MGNRRSDALQRTDGQPELLQILTGGRGAAGHAHEPRVLDRLTVVLRGRGHCVAVRLR